MSTTDVSSWIRANAFPIVALDPEHAHDDLTFLLEEIADARVVALGESTHGTREFTLLKDRIVRMLVREAGFRVIAFERDVPLVVDIDRYMNGEDVEPEAAFSLFSVYPWQTEEFRACIDTLRSWNLAEGDRVSIAGIDMQNPDVVFEFVPKTPEVERAAQAFFRAASGGDDARALWRETVARAEEAAAATADPVGSLSLTTVAQYANAALAELDGHAGLEQGSTTRERAMADNVRMLTEKIFPGQRVVVWAHNGHIGCYPGMMGEHLRQDLGDDYRAIGFFFGHGAYSAATYADGRLDRTLRSFDALPPKPGSVEELLAVDGAPKTYALSLRAGDVPKELFEERPHVEIGFVGDMQEWPVVPVTTLFDAVIYTSESTPAVPLPWSESQIAAFQSRRSS